MLQSKPRTPEETKRYMRELKDWLHEQRELPAEEMAAFFSKRIDVYDSVHLDHWGEEYAHIADYFRGDLNRLLDIGCGTGLELKAIYERFPRVQITGVDLSVDMLKRLREKYKGQRLQLIAANYLEYPFLDNAYDAALSVETLHHLYYETKQTIYQKLFRTIREGGYYMECDYIACCDEEETLCREHCLYRRENSKILESAFVHIDVPLALEHQIELMKNAGFSSVDVLYENCGTVIIRADK